MRPAHRVVFDCNVYMQALISPSGAAGVCLVGAKLQEFRLFYSEDTLAEVRRVSERPYFRGRLRVTDDRVDALIRLVRQAATLVRDVPERYLHVTDPSDSHYVNLALAANAQLIVSRDQDLHRLMDLDRPEARDFRQRFPQLLITDPSGLLRMLDDSQAGR